MMKATLTFHLLSVLAVVTTAIIVSTFALVQMPVVSFRGTNGGLTTAYTIHGNTFRTRRPFHPRRHRQQQHHDGVSALALSSSTILEQATAAATIATTTTAASSFLSLFSSSNDGILLVSNLVHTAADDDDYGELAKTIVIVLTLGGGLIPATIAANRAMIGTLMGTRRGGDDDDASKDESSSRGSSSKSSLDPTIGDTKNRAYVTSSGASGPTLPNAAFLFANEDIPLVDVIAIMGRINDVNSIADWQNLPSTKLDNVSSTNPPMWLPRGAFKVNIRRARWIQWPTDPATGGPVGGTELQSAEEGRISQSGVAIGDAALDAVWDTWAWGASVTTPDKVERTLQAYRPNNGNKNVYFDVNKFVTSAVAGRSVTALAALTFIVIQLIVYTSLFIAPFLRVFADLDIGIGTLGTCDPEKCVRLFQ